MACRPCVGERTQRLAARYRLGERQSPASALQALPGRVVNKINKLFEHLPTPSKELKCN
jgi:hypothetical protein